MPMPTLSSHSSLLLPPKPVPTSPLPTPSPCTSSPCYRLQSTTLPLPPKIREQLPWRQAPLERIHVIFLIERERQIRIERMSERQKDWMPCRMPTYCMAERKEVGPPPHLLSLSLLPSTTAQNLNIITALIGTRLNLDCV